MKLIKNMPLIIPITCVVIGAAIGYAAHEASMDYSPPIIEPAAGKNHNILTMEERKKLSIIIPEGKALPQPEVEMEVSPVDPETAHELLDIISRDQ